MREAPELELTQDSALGILEIEKSTLAGKSPEEKLKIYRAQYRKKALREHPDKNVGDQEAHESFLRVKDAYNFLVNPHKKDGDASFNAYFNHAVTEQIPLSAIDLRLEILIHEEFERLKDIFYRLESDAQKDEFSRKYKYFIAIAMQLEKNDIKECLMNQRIEQTQQLFDSFFVKLSHVWRTDMLRIFGEELLDDFVYREALGMGKLYSALATRKLLNPVKLAAAIIISVLSLIKAGYYHLQIALGTHSQNIINFFDYNKNSTWSEYGQFILSVAILALAISAIPLIASYSYYSFLTISSLPLLHQLSFLLACPTNTFTRPLLHKLGLESLGKYMPFIAPLTLGALGVGAYFLVMAATTTALETAMLTVFALSALYILYALARIIHFSFKQSTALGIFQLVVLGLSIALSFTLGTAAPDPAMTSATLELAGATLNFLSTAVFLNLILRFLENVESFANEMVEKAPYPEEPIPNEFKQVINDSLNYSFYSHELFKTPEDTKPILREQRTFWQGTQGFFGFADFRKEEPDEGLTGLELQTL